MDPETIVLRHREPWTYKQLKGFGGPNPGVLRVFHKDKPYLMNIRYSQNPEMNLEKAMHYAGLVCDFLNLMERGLP